MSRFYERIVVFLFFFEYTYQRDTTTKSFAENTQVELECDPPKKGSTTYWFRLRDSGIEFLATYTSSGFFKIEPDKNIFGTGKIAKNILIIKEFQKERDSGVYSCASMNSNRLNFGEATRIQGHPEPTPTTKTTTMKLPKPTTVTCPSITGCDCKNSKVSPPAIDCNLMIYAPLAGGCGLFCLILIITICYCNRLRKKRCPHHYKRTPKNQVPVRQAMSDRYV
ncbi:hypothetical protein AGOR_G00007800 [Albula goreensis]|uniref:Ig-like domain-containing protein n=1 Tax=Albula goreensis TaxID=1534307 RepID=A0A8T3E6B2_9TELE|nr:hypothetical protein AGOR_G00007800 [Albula goreensis]